MNFRWRRKTIPKPVAHPLCDITINSGVDSYSPTGEHHIVFCMTCGEFVDSDSSIPVLAIREHLDWHKKRS